MSGGSVPIGPGTKVTLKFTIKLLNGEEVDGTGDKPAEFTVGDGNLLQGFEMALFGLKAGDAESLKLHYKQAFGPHREENIQRIKRDSFQSNMNLTEGLMMSFADAANTELPGVIIGIDERYVEVDFNHPLAGKDLLFDVEIIDVQQVSNEILRVSG